MNNNLLDCFIKVAPYINKLTLNDIAFSFSKKNMKEGKKMNTKHVKVEYKDRWALVKISRPKAMNAINSGILDELSSVLDKLNANDDVKVIAFTGEGKAFIAGADIAEMKNMSTIQARDFATKGHETFAKIAESLKPTIAAVNGYALGGGCELALACDIRIASSSAQFGQPEVCLGIIPGFGGTQRLTKLVGPAKAKELLYTSKKISANEAFEMGLVNHVFADDNLYDELEKLAAEIANKSSVILSFAKDAVDGGLEKEVIDGLDYETNLFAMCFCTQDQTEGMDAFLNKRKAEFSDK